MEGPEAGLTTAVTQATELRRQVDAEIVSVDWTNEHGEIKLIVRKDGWDLFVNGDQVPRTIAQGKDT